MNFQSLLNPRKSDFVPLVLGAVLVLLGTAVMAGWITRQFFLVQILPSLVPMQFNTALCFFFVGLAVFAFVYFQRLLLISLALFLISISGLTLLQYLLRLDFGLDRLFFDTYSHFEVTFPGRMAPHTAFGFALAGAAYLFSGLFPAYRRAGWIYYAGSLLVGVGLSALLAYFIAGDQSAYGWRELTRMAVHTACGFILLGFSFVFLSSTVHYKKRIFLFVFLPGILVSLLTLFMLIRQETKQITGNFLRDARAREVAISAGFDHVENLTRAVAGFYEASRFVSPDEFKSFMTWVFSATPQEIQAVEWLPQVLSAQRESFESGMSAALTKPYFIKDRLSEHEFELAPDRAVYYPVAYRAALRKTADLFGYDRYVIPDRKDAMDQARKTQKLRATVPIRFFEESAHGQRGIIFFQWVRSGKEDPDFQTFLQQGFVAAVVRYPEFLRRVLGDNFQNQILISLWDVTNPAQPLWAYSSFDQYRGRVAQEVLPAQMCAPAELSRLARFSSAGRHYLLCQVPTEEFIKQNQSGFPWIGYLMALGIASGLFILISEFSRHNHEIFRAAQAVRQSEDRLRHILEMAPDALFLTDETGQITFSNLKCETVFGFTRAMLMSKSLKDLIPEFSSRNLAQTLTPLEIFSRSVQAFRKDGELFPADISVSLIDSGGQKIVIAVIRDITERCASEKKQNDLLKSVEAVNRELGQFAYVVSHDLKAPLRAVGSLAGWLQADYGQKLGAEGQAQIKLLIQRVERLNSLIDGILHYSRLTRSSEEKNPIDVNALVKEVVENLAPSSAFQILVPENLPVVWGEKTKLFQIFQNLIGNAVKFMDKPQGRIEIKGRAQGGFWQFAVSDNGPGIDEKYHEKIFEIFQTLKRRDEAESTGIGLTIVKKLVESQGGQIWLESRVGTGTTFNFTLPVN